MFTVRGRFAGGDAAVTWDAGHITSDDPVLAAAVVDWAEHREGQPVGPICGPFTYANHLADPLSAYFVIEDLFDRVDEVTGDVPEVPVTPGVVH